MTLEEINQLIVPRKDSFEHILNWIHSTAVVSDIQVLNDFIVCTLPSTEAEKLLECKFYIYQNQHRSNFKLSRCDQPYTVPIQIKPYLDFIGGVTHFPKLPSVTIKPRADPGIGVTPRIIRDRYGIGDTVGHSPNNRQAVAQFLEQYYDEVDLEEFFSLFYWPAIGNTVEKVIGDNYWFEPGIEANLDIQYIMAVGADVKTWFYSIPGLNDNQEPFLDWALIIGNTSDAEVPKVIR